jgi:hypothetical protein
MSKQAYHLFFITAVIIAFFGATLFGQNQEESVPKVRINSTRLAQRIKALAEFGKTGEEGVHRVAFSEEDIKACRYIQNLMQEAGLKVEIDTAGNIIGKREDRVSNLPQ